MVVYGGPGDDRSIGGAGADSLIESSDPVDDSDDDTDVVRGGGGNDYLSVFDWDDLDVADGGAGVDSCSADGGDTVTAC